ncbi:MAG: thiolase family protein, partial [Actinobacteria bacterium]|nr:thiolase family protein [Actinomycetota bacterium]
MEEVGAVGWSQTRHGRALVGETPQSLIYSVVTGALDSCGLSIQDIDVVIDAGSDFLDGRGISSCVTADAMGAQFKEESKVAGDGLLAAIYAYMRIASGLCSTAVVVAYGKSSESSVRKQARTMAEPFYLRSLGLDALSAGALQARAFMQHYGIDPGACAAVAVKNRRAGVKNPHAQLTEELTLDQVERSPEIMSPIRKLEACPITDGACAVVLAEGRMARSIGARTAWITGIGHSADAYSPGVRELQRAASAKRAARSAYEMAGVSDPLSELDLLEVSEFYAYQELMLYEALGLCGEGESADILEAGVTGPGGRAQVNPSGGALCANPLVATGLVRLAEASAQVSGRAGGLQVEGARKALAHAGGGLAMQTAACI